MGNTKEYILCAAWKRKEPWKGPRYTKENSDIYRVEIGYRHGDIVDKHENELSMGKDAMGFLTSKCRFVTRTEAAKIAFEAGQIDEKTAKWDAKLVEELNKIQYVGQPPKLLVAGDWRPLASEDLY